MWEGEGDEERVAVQISMFLKYCADMERRGSQGGPFRNISSKFRVQSMDRTNVKTDHITIGTKSYIVQYLPQRNTDDSTETIQVWLTQEPVLSEKSKERFLNKSGGILVHRYYSVMTPPAGNVRTMEISIIQASLRRRGRKVWNLNEEWIEGDITFQIDGNIKTVFLATEGDWHSRDDTSQIVWIHLPELCAGIKTTKRNLLTFAGRLDERLPGGSAAELGTS